MRLMRKILGPIVLCLSAAMVILLASGCADRNPDGSTSDSWRRRNEAKNVACVALFALPCDFSTAPLPANDDRKSGTPEWKETNGKAAPFSPQESTEFKNQDDAQMPRVLLRPGRVRTVRVFWLDDDHIAYTQREIDQRAPADGPHVVIRDMRDGSEHDTTLRGVAQCLDQRRIVLSVPDDRTGSHLVAREPGGAYVPAANRIASDWPVSADCEQKTNTPGGGLRIPLRASDGALEASSSNQPGQSPEVVHVASNGTRTPLADEVAIRWISGTDFNWLPWAGQYSIGVSLMPGHESEGLMFDPATNHFTRTAAPRFILDLVRRRSATATGLPMSSGVAWLVSNPYWRQQGLFFAHSGTLIRIDDRDVDPVLGGVSPDGCRLVYWRSLSPPFALDRWRELDQRELVMFDACAL